jgi:murein DD-endopeptidase MepM/ murein hydrolase activator NlpD
MRNRDSAFRYRVLGNAAFIVVAAGVAASCSNATRLQEPFFTGSTENQRQIIGQVDPQPMPAAIQPGSTAVSRADLPPPPTSSYAAPAPAPVSATVAANTGEYGWSAVGGQVITVKSGQTLDSLAALYGVPQQQLLAANQMRSPADVRAGKVLVIPHRVALAPDAAIRPTPVSYEPPATRAPAPLKSAAGTHTVGAGDTLYSIARRYGTTVSQMVSLNGLPSAEAIHVGQTLRLPGAGAVAAAAPATVPGAEPTRVASLDPKAKIPATTTLTTPTLATPKVEEPPMASTAGAPTVPAVPSVPVIKGGSNDAAAASAAIDQAADAGSASGTEFRWPVRGRIIAGFGAKPNGEKNDGINLAVPEGTAVKAAEAGTVIYAGNELEGYGNLVLIRHADGWVSAYANNKDLSVKRGDKVRRGETLAHAGMTGSVSSPQVHFELRKGAKPVNPLDYLAS